MDARTRARERPNLSGPSESSRRTSKAPRLDLAYFDVETEHSDKTAMTTPTGKTLGPHLGKTTPRARELLTQRLGRLLTIPRSSDERPRVSDLALRGLSEGPLEHIPPHDTDNDSPTVGCGSPNTGTWAMITSISSDQPRRSLVDVRKPLTGRAQTNMRPAPQSLVSHPRTGLFSGLLAHTGQLV